MGLRVAAWQRRERENGRSDERAASRHTWEDCAVNDGDRVLTLVEAHVVSALGRDSGRASVSFLGTERIDILRFGPGPDDLVRYVTLGMSRAPMTAADSDVLAADGPRAELVLTVRGVHDSVLNQLAVLAAVPAVEGMVVLPGARLELGAPLWAGAGFPAVLIGEPADSSVPSLDDPAVDFLPVFPVTTNELAWARVHGSDALLVRWRAEGTDINDPRRSAVDLRSP